MSFLKKTNLGATAPTTKPVLGAKKLGGIKPQPVEIDLEPDTPKVVPTAKLGGKKIGALGASKPKLGAIKKEEVKEEPVVAEVETTEELQFEKAEAPKATKKLGGIKKLKETVEAEEQGDEIEVTNTPEESAVKVDDNGNVAIKAKTLKVTNKNEEEPALTVDEEGAVEVKEEKKTPTKRKTTKKKATTSDEEVIAELEVDESKRVDLPEMDTVMRPIVAPTTELWEQEKKDVLEALNNIKVEQDMTMSQVKNCLADLDELNFEILPKLHDSETMYDGTKQNYDTVKAVAIAKGSGGNAEARKAEGILACKNFVTPSGAVVDLHQYMLLIEERYKFYQKVTDGINFKKYSLVNYNNALKVESKSA